MRSVKPVTQFSDMELPEMSAFSNGELMFLMKTRVAFTLPRPEQVNMTTSSIHVQNIKQRPMKMNITQAWEDISGNLTCMKHQPARGSPQLNTCFFSIVQILKDLPDEELTKVAQFYFQDGIPILARSLEDRFHMIDAFGVVKTEHAQEILMRYILMQRMPDHRMVQRILMQVIGMEKLPTEPLLKMLEDMCFDRDKFSTSMFKADTYQRALLTYGAVISVMEKEGHKERAQAAIQKFHDMLGLHDPWEYRRKRESMTPEEREVYVHEKVTLIGALGNAAHHSSLEYIVSHINSTNSPWIKRAAIHALRDYHHADVADFLLHTAANDDDEYVRYDAVLQYQAHPKANVIITNEQR
ncbi:hypothetical protein CHS0354_035947 [Potamilus streckersoni]|uniref:HEAT repeat domain-containing protein n=1 Tax=Potamilus streckersoni TaxID=2493646 RepID=A0AAE0WDK7_9BIVA|nr:hypothetical protein CHS0354_035947 [Potamilus streckersoni]